MKNNLNMNFAFAGFAALGLVLALALKLVFSSDDNSFYPTLICFVVLLLAFHRLCFISIVEGKYKDMGDGKRLTDASVVDSVYYLGFTYTLLILVTSFISMGQDAGSIRLKYDSQLAGLMDILNRFCVGLFTTGYGLVARIQLSNLVEIEELDPEGLREKLNVKTAALISVIDHGTASLTSLISSSNEAIVNSVRDSTNSLTEKSNLLADNLSEISSNLSKVLAKLKRQVTSLDLTDATGAIEAHLNNTARGVEGLNHSIDGITTKFNTAGDAVGESSQVLISVMRDINSQYEHLLRNLDSFSDGLAVTSGSVMGIDSAVKQSTASMDQFKDEIANSISNLGRLSEGLSEALNRFSSFSSAANNSQVNLESGSSALGNSMTKGASEIEQNIRVLSERIRALNSTLADIQKKISSKY